MGEGESPFPRVRGSFPSCKHGQGTGGLALELEGTVGHCVLPVISEVSNNVFFLVPSLCSIVVTGSFCLSLLFAINCF